MSLHQMIRNFGRNVCFTPREIHAPQTEQEVLDLLDKNAGGGIRVIGSRHAWSPAIVTDDVLLDLRHFNSVEIDRTADGEVWATIGGGCQIKTALKELDARANCTLPAIGMITEQTIAGASATGTHGSGRNSLSHYLSEVRLAAYDPRTGKARIYVINGGEDLQAARCALGCMGVVLSVRLRCIPQYLIAEEILRYKTLDEVLAREDDFPRQHFFLIPHLWEFIALQQREIPMDQAQPSRLTWLFKLYTVVVLDIGYHAGLIFLLNILRIPALVRQYCRKFLPAIVLEQQMFVGRSDLFLTMQIDRFRHLEMELFVQSSRLRRAARFVQEVLTVADGKADSVSDEFADELNAVGLMPALEQLRSTFTHHYPITFRRVFPDDTLISMASGGNEPWYAISLITYQRNRHKFCAVADFLAHAMAVLFGARAHWGKYFPLNHTEVDRLYPKMATFREICQRHDVYGTFRNQFCNRVLNFGSVCELPIPGAISDSPSSIETMPMVDESGVLASGR